MDNKFKWNLRDTDPIVYDLILKEKKRQTEGLELIPSESYASSAVIAALGSVFNNKYSEGYPRKRYYGGNEFVDQVEELAIERAKKLFNCEHANVQPYSGSPANLEAYFALMNFGDKAMGMSLTEGGHLTHGHPVNFSGKAYKFVQYGVEKETELLDMDSIRKLAEKEKPKLIVSGATAYPRIIDFKEFSEIAKDVDAYAMADIAHIAGLIAGGAHPSCFPFMDVVTTTTHKTLNGPRGAMIMCKKEDRLQQKYCPDSKLNLAQRIDKAVFPGMQGGPHDNQIAAKAVAFGEALKPEFKNYAHQVVKNARALAESLMDGGIRLVTGGTDNHLILADLTPVNVTGKQAEEALDKALITLNKNTIPFETRSPFDPSGIRMGTPAITSRGFKESECREVGNLIVKAVKKWNDDSALKKVRQEVIELTKNFPMYD